MIDYLNTKILLLGVGEFLDEKIRPIPNITSNLTHLKDLFENENIYKNLKGENIISVLNGTQKEISRAIINITKNTTKKDTLIIYYAGHGIISKDDFELYLPAKDSFEEYIDNEGISIKKFKNYIKRSLASRKIVIMDCCFSGRIHGTMSSDEVSSQVSSQILPVISGTYIMTSSSPDKPSLYSTENPNIPTFFTDKLIDVISSGLDNNKSYYEVGEIFEEVKKEFEKTPNMPIPQQSSFNEAEKIPVGNNLREFSLREILKKNRELNLELKTLKEENSKLIKKDNSKLIESLELDLKKVSTENKKLKNLNKSLTDKIESQIKNNIKGNNVQSDDSVKIIFTLIVGFVITVVVSTLANQQWGGYCLSGFPENLACTWFFWLVYVVVSMILVRRISINK